MQKKVSLAPYFMIFKRFVILSLIPLALWANTQNVNSPISNVTESEFSRDSIAQDSNSFNIETADEIAKEIAENIEEEIAEDSTAEEPELSQEEADAEISALTDSVLIADSLSTDSVLQVLKLDMKYSAIPTESRRISSPYGIRTYRMHRGVDMGLCHGENRAILAAFPGVVSKVRNQGRRRGYGKFVIIDHGNGFTTLYAHLAKWQVNVGDTVQAGDTIGVGGNSGRSFGAHLHFEMRYNNLYIDPTQVFNFEEGTPINEITELNPIALQATEDEFQKELAKHRYYKVRRGDCLGKIARKYGISIKRLKQLNRLKGDMIRPGQVLKCS